MKNTIKFIPLVGIRCKMALSNSRLNNHAVVVAAAIAVIAFKAPCENFWALIIGHPLALTAILSVRLFPSRNPQWPWVLLIIRAPLSFYIGHLAVLICLCFAV